MKRYFGAHYRLISVVSLAALLALAVGLCVNAAPADSDAFFLCFESEEEEIPSAGGKEESQPLELDLFTQAHILAGTFHEVLSPSSFQPGAVPAKPFNLRC